MPQYKTIIHEWFEEIWNQKKAVTIGRLLAADAVVHGITDEKGVELCGPEGFAKFHARFLNAFPNIKVEVLDFLVDGDKIACRCIVRGKHQGDGLGFTATQKEIEFTGMCIGHIKNGKIVEGWNNFDFLGLYSQLGVLDKLGTAKGD